MGEQQLNKLIKDFKNGESEIFLQIVDKMNPLINKYVRIMYKDEKEDMRQEFILCLLESVNVMKYYAEEGQCVYFLSRALKNKFHELYKKSKLHFDSETLIDDEYLTHFHSNQPEYDDCIICEDLTHLMPLDTKSNQYQILYSIVFQDKTDTEIANRLPVSRQYVNRIRRNFYKLLKEEYFK